MKLAARPHDRQPRRLHDEDVGRLMSIEAVDAEGMLAQQIISCAIT